jgi:divalent metal cation (Fe/Co/Zn/Cd) transporter
MFVYPFALRCAAGGAIRLVPAVRRLHSISLASRGVLARSSVRPLGCHIFSAPALAPSSAMRRAVAHRSHRWAWLSTATPPPAAAAAAAAAVGAAAPDSGVVPARRRQSKADREKLLAAEKSDEHSFTAVLRALSVNGLITVIKFAAYWKTGSSSMLAEAIHTLVDTGNQAILVIGLQQSRRVRAPRARGVVRVRVAERF